MCNEHSVHAGTLPSREPLIDRPSFEEIFMRLAVDLSSKSTCRRRAVGCVITSNDFRHVYAIGYNGNASKLDNDCDSTEIGNCGCLHAEENACIKNTSKPYEKKIVFISTLPCVPCTKRLINLEGIEKIYYHDGYRCDKAIKLLQDERVNIAIEQLLVQEEFLTVRIHDK